MADGLVDLSAGGYVAPMQAPDIESGPCFVSPRPLKPSGLLLLLARGEQSRAEGRDYSVLAVKLTIEGVVGLFNMKTEVSHCFALMGISL